MDKFLQNEFFLEKIKIDTWMHCIHTFGNYWLQTSNYYLLPQRCLFKYFENDVMRIKGNRKLYKLSQVSQYIFYLLWFQNLNEIIKTRFMENLFNSQIRKHILEGIHPRSQRLEHPKKIYLLMFILILTYSCIVVKSIGTLLALLRI